MELAFKHNQSAHCENGVTSNLLQHAGVGSITEPLAFGIGAGLFYIYVPLVKINNGPFISFRNMPGTIFKRTCVALNIPVVRQRFRTPQQAQQALDQQLEQGQPVGCQVGVYYLPYFPKEYRFHFNAHNLVVYGKTDDTYLISDPVMETATTLTRYELERVRFAKGPLAPSGQMYYPQAKQTVTDAQIKQAIIKGIKRNTRDMLHIPGPIAGVSGIVFTANRIKNWRNKLGLEKAGIYLAQLVRMQEEIGTGGGGFRFIYGAFLQQAYPYLQKDELLNISEQFTRAGDIWRSAAVQASGIFKGRLTQQSDFNDMAAYLHQVAEVEKNAFKALAKLKL
jgi:hypothetical protein